jgi:hypothetical protein
LAITGIGWVRDWAVMGGSPSSQDIDTSLHPDRHTTRILGSNGRAIRTACRVSNREKPDRRNNRTDPRCTFVG